MIEMLCERPGKPPVVVKVIPHVPVIDRGDTTRVVIEGRIISVPTYTLRKQ